MQSEQEPNEIRLSHTTEQLLDGLGQLRSRAQPDEFTKLSVSRAVSFVAILYEKVRNAIEYREEHLIRRAAIERILRRRLSLNPAGTGEGENLLRELLWARYFPKHSLGADDAAQVQSIIDRLLFISTQIKQHVPQDKRAFASQWILDAITCEIEETLNPSEATREMIYSHFLFQTLHETVRIEDVSPEMKDLYCMIAIEKTYRKSDQPYQRAHTFLLFSDPISQLPDSQFTHDFGALLQRFENIDNALENKVGGRLVRYFKKHLPPFLILFSLINDTPAEQLRSLLRNRQALWSQVQQQCSHKYQQVQKRLTILSIRSLIYIIITKMILVLLLEVPISQFLYNEVPILPIAINALFPPLLMVMIVLWFRLPGKENTARIFHRIVHIIDANPSFENRVNLITKNTARGNGVLRTIFSLVYLSTFLITLAGINWVLTILEFHLLSKLLFIFFISVVSFFAYRIKQVVNEYRLVERDSLLSPITDFFFLPILALGKLFNSGMSQLNFFTFIFDVIIEAPFKLIMEVIDEWLKFVRARKEEII